MVTKPVQHKKRHRAAAHDDDDQHPQHFRTKAQAAPLIDLDMAPDQVDDFQTMFAKFPDLRAILATKKHEDGVDNMYGDRMERVIKLIATEAHIALADISKINFRAKSGELYEKFTSALNNHHLPNETPQQVVARVEAVAPPLPAPEPAPAPSRLGQYDPANLAKLSDAELNNVLQDGLHGLREIVGGSFGSYRRDGKLNEVLVGKLHEQEKKLLGMDGKARRESGLDRDTLEKLATAIGEKIAADTNLAQYDRGNLARVSDSQLNDILKDGLYNQREISRGPFGIGMGSYQHNGELGTVTTSKVFEQQRELLGVRKGEESLDRRTLEDTAAAMGQEVAKRTGLAPMDAALNQARTSGALPPQGAVANPQAARGDQSPASGPRQADSNLTGIY